MANRKSKTINMTAEPNVEETISPVQKKKWIKKPHIIGFFIFMLVFAAGFYIAYDRRPPVEVLEQWAVPTEVYPGGKVEIFWKAKVLRFGCVGVVKRRIVDASGNIHLYDEIQSVIRLPDDHEKNDTDVYEVELGEIKTYSRALILPNIVPGKAFHGARVEYKCSFIQKIFDWPIVMVRKTVELNVKPEPLLNLFNGNIKDLEKEIERKVLDVLRKHQQKDEDVEKKIIDELRKHEKRIDDELKKRESIPRERRIPK